MEMSNLGVYGAVGILVSLIIVVIAIGSLIILSNSWFGRDTNRRLSKLEDGQAKLEDGQAKLEDGQASLNKRMDKLDKRMDKLEVGLAELKTYFEIELKEIKNLIKSALNQNNKA